MVGQYGGEVKCHSCIHSRYPNGLGQYIFEVDIGSYYIDSAITAVEDSNAEQLQILKFGKLRSMNSSRRPGRSARKNARNCEPNVEFVEWGEVKNDDSAVVTKRTLVVEVRVIKGKVIAPGQELLCSYSFPSAKQVEKSVCSCCVFYNQG